MAGDLQTNINYEYMQIGLCENPTVKLWYDEFTVRFVVEREHNVKSMLYTKQHYRTCMVVLDKTCPQGRMKTNITLGLFNHIQTMFDHVKQTLCRHKHWLYCVF